MDAEMICPYCSSEAQKVSGEKIYPHRRDHDPAYVGTHKDGKPFGTLADAETRKARSLAHQDFDKIWKDGLLSRSEAYEVLSTHMNLPPEKTHIGMFSAAQANEVVVFSTNLYNLLKELEESHDAIEFS